MRGRLVTRLFALPAAIAAAIAVVFVFTVQPSLALTQGPSCGEQTMKNENGIAIKVLFAKNGSVQRYVVVDSKENTEQVNDFMLLLERAYGEAATNAPPLRIVSFKPGTNGMMIPDKAVDSCGRTLSFQ